MFNIIYTSVYALGYVYISVSQFYNYKPSVKDKKIQALCVYWRTFSCELAVEPCTRAAHTHRLGRNCPLEGRSLRFGCCHGGSLEPQVTMLGQQGGLTGTQMMMGELILPHSKRVSCISKHLDSQALLKCNALTMAKVKLSV